MNEVYFVSGEIRGVRTKQEKLVFTLGGEDFKVEGGPRIRKPFPGEAELAGLFGEAHFCGTPENDGGRLQIDGSSQDAVPQVVCSDNGQANRLAALFGHGESFREQILLDAAK